MTQPLHVIMAWAMGCNIFRPTGDHEWWCDCADFAHAQQGESRPVIRRYDLELP